MRQLQRPTWEEALEEAERLVRRDVQPDDIAEESPGVDYEAWVAEAAREMAEDIYSAAEEEWRRQLRPAQRIAEGVGDVYDIIDLLTEEIERRTGVAARCSGSSEAAYIEIGLHRMRLAGHQSRPTWERLYGAPEVELIVGGSPEATHCLRARPTVDEIIVMAAELAAIVQRWLDEEEADE